MALLSRRFGSKFARAFALAHESQRGRLDRRVMDHHNNEVGLQIAAANPNLTDAQVAERVDRALKEGRLVVIDGNGNLQPSHKVKVDEHGAANDPYTKATGREPKGDVWIKPRR